MYVCYVKWPECVKQIQDFWLNLTVLLRNFTVDKVNQPLFIYVQRLKVLYNDICRSCNNMEEVESIETLLFQYPALRNLKWKIFGPSEFINRTCQATILQVLVQGITSNSCTNNEFNSYYYYYVCMNIM